MENKYKNQFLGVVEDPRTEEEKKKDWQYEETARALPVEWKGKKEWVFYSRRDQDGSLSCMAQSGAKLLGIENVVEEGEYIEPSATPVYKARSNKPSGGMWQQNCLELFCTPLACLESELPSQKLSESQINASYEKTEEQAKSAERYRAGGYSFVSIDINKIASVIAEGKAVQLVLFFTAEEWWNGTQDPKIIKPKLTRFDDEALRHGVAATDFGLRNGVKTLKIEDSAVLTSETGERYITEEFLLKRCYGAGYLLPLPNDHDNVKKPKYKFVKALEYNTRKNKDVVALQDILKYEKFMLESVPSTGNFLNITAKSLKNWQIAHGIMDFKDETDMTTIRAGQKTIAELNKIYSQ